MINLTILEKQVLRNYLPHQSVYDFGQCPMTVKDIGNAIWETEHINISNSTIKGVVGSLVKKEILTSQIAEVNPLIWLSDRFRDKDELFNEIIELSK